MNEISSVAGLTAMYAKAYGIYFLVTGLGLIVNPQRFRAWYNDIVSESRRVLFGGTIALLIGSFIVATHNHIVADWSVIISLIGYWGVFAGAGCLLSDKFIGLYKFMIKSSDLVYRVSGVAWVVLGLFLASKGFAF